MQNRSTLRLSGITPWFFAFLKRLLLKPLFWILLLLFPLLSAGVRLYTQSSQPLIQVALYNEGNTSLAKETISSLKEVDSTITFYETASVQQLYEDVKTTKAECGYIFTAKYCSENILKETNKKHAVKVVQSPSSLLTGSINELVFASYFKTHNRQLLTDYLQQPGLVTDRNRIPEIVSQSAAYYEAYTQNELILQLVFNKNNRLPSSESLSDDAQKTTRIYLTNLCRGILSVLMLLSGFCGGLQMINDRRKGLFAAFAPAKRIMTELLDTAAPVTLTALSGLAGMCLLPKTPGFLLELGGLLFYVPAVTLATYLLIRLMHYSRLFYTLVPLLTLCALIFSPVFIDLAAYSKIFTLPKYLFINTWYLNLFL